MNILLICAPYGVPLYANPQLGVFRLGHHLRRAGHGCDIFDPVIDRVEDWKPGSPDYDLIGLSGNNFCMQEGLDLLRGLRDRQKTRPFLFAGGITPTYNPDDWLDCGLDAVILGYGEEPLAALAGTGQALSEDRDAALADIDGLAWRDRTGRTRRNPAAPVTAELFTRLSYDNMLDVDIPYPRYWSLNEKVADSLSVDWQAFIVKTTRQFTSSQCPNRCGYCPSKFLTRAQGFAAGRRTLRPEQSLELIRRDWERYGCDMVLFNDEEFLCDKKTAGELACLIIQAKKDGRLPAGLCFQCQSRVVDFLTGGRADREFLALLEAAGFNRISLGVENICPRLLAVPAMNKAQYSAAEVSDIVGAFLETSVTLHLNFMLLVPETTREELSQNLEFILSLLKKKVMVLLNLHILAAPGAPAVDSGAYEMDLKTVVSPLNGRRLVLPDRFLVRDPELRATLSRLDQTIEEITGAYLSRRGRREKAISQTHRAAIACLALAGVLGEDELRADFEGLLEDLG